MSGKAHRLLLLEKATLVIGRLFFFLPPCFSLLSFPSRFFPLNGNVTGKLKRFRIF